MSEPRWTPGPWIAHNIGEKENCYVIGVSDDKGYGGAICFVEEGSHAAEGSLHADARLIAAAPELYNALRDVLGAWESKSGLGTISEMQRAIPYVRAALARARGETP